MPATAISLLCAASLAAAASAADRLRFTFDDASRLGAQTGSLPAGQVLGPVAPASAAGAAEFSGGLIKVPGFKGPQGPFTIEARFKAGAYGDEDSRFAAEILNTATWDNGPTQGFVFRIGGGYLYPVLPREGYRSEAEWLASQGDYSYIDRGRLSACFADFVIARADDDRNWKQAFTDRCIELGAWTHMAATWDGTDMRIYLNGLEATDPWRLDGVGKPPRIDSVATAFVGARYDGSFDPRPFKGQIDFVRMEDGALSAAEIHARYKETFMPADQSGLCTGIAIPKYPEAGQICKGGMQLEIKVQNHGACTDPAFVAGFLSGDSLEIEFSKDPSFAVIAARVKAATTSLRLEAKDLGELSGYAGAVYWRVRLLPRAASGGAPAKRAAADPEWSPARPVVLDLSGTSVLGRAAPRLVMAVPGLTLPDRGGEPGLYDLRGHRVPARFARVPGGWRLAKAPHGSGALLAR
jgi:hypothetical protein